MVYEYAIDPKLAVRWGKNRSEGHYFIQKFGLGQPRMISKYPNNWKRRFWEEAAGANDMEHARIEELYKKLTETMIRRNGVNYESNTTWLENTERVNMEYTFRAILALDNPRQQADVIKQEDFDQNDPRWDVRRSATPSRNARDMAEAVSAILQNSNTIIFIDPYFTPCLPRWNKWRDTLKAFLQESVKNHRLKDKKRVEIQTSIDYNKAPSLETFQQECMQRLPCCIPCGMTVTVKRWEQRASGEKLHNRYILTNLGGVMFGIGLDTGPPGQRDDVILMSRETYELRWGQYAGDSPAFDLESEFEINGAM